MKKNKYEDRSRWKAEWRKEGNEMIKPNNNIQQSWGRRTDAVTMERDGIKSLHKESGSKEKKPGKSERYFHNKYSVQSIWNCKEEPKRGSAKQHVQYADCRKEKQINNG